MDKLRTGYMASLITKYQPNRMLHSSSLSLLHVPTVKTVTYVLNLLSLFTLENMEPRYHKVSNVLKLS